MTQIMFRTGIAIVAFLFTPCIARTGEIFEVTLNTAPLDLTSGFLAFDFVAGSPQAGNTVQISNFTTDGTTGALTKQGAASGTIVGGTGTLSDSQFFNELLQAINFGNTIRFQLSINANVVAGGIPDDFALYLLSSTRNPYATTDPTGADSLLDIDISSNNPVPSIYNSSFASAALGPTAPEPQTFALVIVAACASGAVLAVRRLRASSVA